MTFTQKLKTLALSTIAFLGVQQAAEAQNYRRCSRLGPWETEANVGFAYRNLNAPAFYVEKQGQFTAEVKELYHLDDRTRGISLYAKAGVELPLFGTPGGERKYYSDLIGDQGEKKLAASIGAGIHIEGFYIGAKESFVMVSGANGGKSAIVPVPAAEAGVDLRLGAVQLNIGIAQEFGSISGIKTVGAHVDNRSTLKNPTTFSVGVKVDLLKVLGQ